MDKLALAKKIGKAALKLGGLAGADDKVKRLEAEKELLELKLIVAVAALRDIRKDVANPAMLAELDEALAIVDRME